MRRQTLPSHPSHIRNNVKVKVELLQSRAMPCFPYTRLSLMPLVTATTPGSPGASTVLPSQVPAGVYQIAPVSRQYQQEGGRVSPIQSLFQQLQLHRGINWSSVTTKSSCIKSRHLFIFLITLLLPFFSLYYRTWKLVYSHNLTIKYLWPSRQIFPGRVPRHYSFIIDMTKERNRIQMHWL